MTRPINRKLVTAALIAAGFDSQARADAVRAPTYEVSRRQYEMFAGKYDYVMFGDSLTERGKWQDMFPNLRIGNRGIGGDDTGGMLARIDTVVRTGARTVFIMAGTNDLSAHAPVADIVDNISQMARILREKRIRVVVQSTLLAGEARAWKNKFIAAINEGLAANARTNGYDYLDINADLAPDGVLPERYTIDGVHLNADGYAVWRSTLDRFIRKSN
jgi:lysophospholipase L1-like esterase